MFILIPSLSLPLSKCCLTLHLFQPPFFLLHHYSLNAYQYAIVSYLQWCCITDLVFQSSVLLQVFKFVL